MRLERLLGGSSRLAAGTGFLLLICSCFGDPKFDAAFNRVELGMNRPEVVRLLGEPDEQASLFHLAQREGFEAEYERAEQSGAYTYLYWNRDIDLVYALGIDSADRVVFKAVGGT